MTLQYQLPSSLPYFFTESIVNRKTNSILLYIPLSCTGPHNVNKCLLSCSYETNCNYTEEVSVGSQFSYTWLRRTAECSHFYLSFQSGSHWHRTLLKFASFNDVRSLLTGVRHSYLVGLLFRCRLLLTGKVQRMQYCLTLPLAEYKFLSQVWPPEISRFAYWHNTVYQCCLALKSSSLKSTSSFYLLMYRSKLATAIGKYSYQGYRKK